MLQPPRYAKRTFLYLGLLLFAGPTAALAGDPTGDWQVADGVAHIRVAACHGSMWGAVAWEKIPGGRDKNNPDPAKRSRLTLGMPILLDMKKKAGGDEWAGKVYNAKDGKTYDATITLNSPNELEIEGCVLGILCGGETWKRVSGPIPSSPANDASGAAPKAGAKSSAGKKASPAPKGAQKAAPAPGSAQETEDIGDICLLPGIAGATH